jgi:hypothetical protein
MRTTVRLDEDLLRRSKALAARTGRTLTAVIEDALRETLARQQRRRSRPRSALPTFKGRGLRPGVDLNDSAGLLDIMEGGRDPA